MRFEWRHSMVIDQICIQTGILDRSKCNLRPQVCRYMSAAVLEFRDCLFLCELCSVDSRQSCKRRQSLAKLCQKCRRGGFFLGESP